MSPEHLLSGNTNQKKVAEGNSQWTFELGRIHLTNIHAQYKDDATGNDATLFLSDFQTTIKTFDPNQLVFAIPVFSVNGLKGHLRQYNPTMVLQKEKVEEISKARDSRSSHLQLRKIELDSILLSYSSELSDTKAQLNIDLISIIADSIDLNKMQFDLKSLDLNQSKVQVVLGKSHLQKQDKIEVTEKPGTQRSWMVNLANLNLVNDAFSLDDM